MTEESGAKEGAGGGGENEPDNDADEEGGDGGEEGGAEDHSDDAIKSAVLDTVEANTSVVEDLEIAWETLELAREILTPLASDHHARVKCISFIDDVTFDSTPSDRRTYYRGPI